MIDKEDLACAFRIMELRTKVLDLNLKQIEQNCYNNTKELKTLDFELSMLMKSLTKYDFISKINGGNILLVGEGNISFTISLVKNCM